MGIINLKLAIRREHVPGKIEKILGKKGVMLCTTLGENYPNYPLIASYSEHPTVKKNDGWIEIDMPLKVGAYIHYRDYPAQIQWSIGKDAKRRLIHAFPTLDEFGIRENLPSEMRKLRYVAINIETSEEKINESLKAMLSYAKFKSELRERKSA